MGGQAGGNETGIGRLDRAHVGGDVVHPIRMKRLARRKAYPPFKERPLHSAYFIVSGNDPARPPFRFASL